MRSVRKGRQSPGHHSQEYITRTRKTCTAHVTTHHCPTSRTIPRYGMQYSRAVITTRLDASRSGAQATRTRAWPTRTRAPATRACARTANLRTKILDFRVFDSSIILVLRGGILIPQGDFPETLSEPILAGIIFVGRLLLRRPFSVAAGARRCPQRRSTRRPPQSSTGVGLSVNNNNNSANNNINHNRYSNNGNDKPFPPTGPHCLTARSGCAMRSRGPGNLGRLAPWRLGRRYHYYHYYY